MPTPINAELFVSSFDPTGNVGEYSFSSAVFNNQADVTGNGAYDVLAGMVVYVPASSAATAMPIPGVVHRYKLTSVEVIDPTTISGVVVWDEEGSEEDQPTPGSYCLLTETTSNKKLGLVAADVLYPSVPQGTTVGALRSDTKNILDKASGGSGSSGITRFTFSESLRWVVQHNKGTLVFMEALKDSTGRKLYADVEVLDANSFAVNLTEATAGTVDVVFGA